MKDMIVKEAVFTSDIDKIWNAISRQEEISQWFLKADFKAETGYRYTFSSDGEDCEPIIGRVIQASPYDLIYTWQVAGTDVETTVEWHLESVSEGTKLTLKHWGISKYGEGLFNKMFESFNGGWDNCLNGLQQFMIAPTYAQ